jgi:hypothetical protein
LFPFFAENVSFISLPSDLSKSQNCSQESSKVSRPENRGGVMGTIFAIVFSTFIVNNFWQILRSLYDIFSVTKW